MIKQILFILIFSVNAWAATYYVDYVGGSDSNNGTSKSTPWKHAPGMQGCTGNCASYQTAHNSPSETSGAGNNFILKGGVTCPLSVLPWDWVYGSGTTASPIYFGVDQTWYSGDVWSRPILDAENSEIPLDVWSVALMARFYGDGYIVDNIEFKRLAQLSDDHTQQPGMLGVGTSEASVQGIEVKNCYFHGWSHGGTSIHDNMFIMGSVLWSTIDIKLKIHHNVFDGSDTTKDMAGIIKRSVGHFYNNYVSDVSNMLVATNTGYIWGNTFVNIAIPRGINCTAQNGVASYFSYDCTTHGNTDETYGTHYGYYNNYSNHVGGGANLIYYPSPSGSTSIFNNVIVDDGNQTMQLGAQYMTSGNSFGYNIFNNTINGIDDVGSINGGYAGGSYKFGWAKIQNNHIISSPQVNSINMSAYTTTITQDHNVDMTPAQATSANYTTSSTYPYFPPVGGSTVNTGTSLSSICSGLSDVSPSLMATDCLKDTTLGVDYNATTHTVSYPKRTPITRTTWDIGAYEYASGGTTYTLTYQTTTCASISGTNTQSGIESGHDGTQVTAVPATGYHFVQWDDALATAARTDTNVTADHTYTASCAVNAASGRRSGGVASGGVFR
jgi:hypothetical protein